jgi:hypothetical protein
VSCTQATTQRLDAGIGKLETPENRDGWIFVQHRLSIRRPALKDLLYEWYHYQVQVTASCA